MKRTPLFLFGLFTIITFLGFTQNRNANVIGTISYGETEYCYLNEAGTNIIYKSAAYISSELNDGQLVEIQSTENEGQVKVISSSLSTELYAQKNEVGNELFLEIDSAPTLEYEILFFENEEKAKNYYESIELYLDHSNEELDVNDLLDNIEESFAGYESFRTFFNNKYDFENGEFQKEQITRIEEEDFLSDEILKTLLNKDRLVGLGNEIIYFHNETQKVRIQKSDIDALLTLQSINDDDDLFLMNLDSKYEIEAPLVQTSKYEKGFVIISGKKYETSPQVENVNCSIYEKRLRILFSECTWDQVPQDWDCTVLSGLDLISFPYSIQLTIDWGDGSPLETISDYTCGYVNHVYPTQGVYYPTTTFSFSSAVIEDGNGTTGNSIVMNVSTSCQENPYHTYGNTFSNDWILTSKLWYKINMFGTKIGAYSHAWKKQNNGYWKRKKATLHTKVMGDFRNDDCDIALQKQGQKTKTRKKVQKTKSSVITDYDIYNGDVRSIHWLSKGSIYIYKELVLNPCN